MLECTCIFLTHDPDMAWKIGPACTSWQPGLVDFDRTAGCKSALAITGTRKQGLKRGIETGKRGRHEAGRQTDKDLQIFGM